MRSDQDHQQLTRIRNASVGHQFSQEDAEAPDVALDAEPAVFGSFRCGPPDGEHEADPGLVLVLLDQPRQPEVSDLHVVVLTDKTVPEQKFNEKKFNIFCKVRKTILGKF